MSGRSRRDFLLAGAATLASGGLALVAGGRPRRRPAPDPDVCIVGTGFAGTFLAQGLTERGFSVLLVEAGQALEPEAPPAGAVAKLPWRAEGEIPFPIDETRTIGLGGTSRRWNGIATRLLPEDFRTRSLYGFAVDWPFGYDELEPWYCRAEAALGVRAGGPSGAAEQARSCALPGDDAGYSSPARLFPGRDLAFFPIPLALAPGRKTPVRLDLDVLPALLGSGRIALRTGLTALRFRRARGGEIGWVEVLGEDGRTEALGARAFVAAAGPFENARLLLASADRLAPTGLGNAGRQVGANLNAHPRFSFDVHHASEAAFLGKWHRSFDLARSYRRRGLAAAMLDVRFRVDALSLDVMVEQQPSEANRVLARERPEPGRLLPTRLELGWSAIDRATCAAAERTLLDLAGLFPAAPRVPPDPWMKWFHPAGTCRMATDPLFGAVDPELRVFGTENLYACGSSSFPTSGCGNPTLTVVALALRLADHLGRELART